MPAGFFSQKAKPRAEFNSGRYPSSYEKLIGIWIADLTPIVVMLSEERPSRGEGRSQSKHPYPL
jgi:hypothetical protein